MPPQQNLFGSAFGAAAEKAKLAAERAKEKAAAAATSASTRLSESGLRESLESARSTVAAAASTGAESIAEGIKTTIEADRIEITLREKNRRILELEEKQAKLNAQLKKALFGDALGEATALAKQREQELETMKQRTMAKFKDMAKEKAALEERIRTLERETVSASASAASAASSPFGAMSTVPASPSAFDSPELRGGDTGSAGHATPMTAGCGDGLLISGLDMPGSSEPPQQSNERQRQQQQQLAEATNELKRLRETITQKDGQLAELRGKGREVSPASSSFGFETTHTTCVPLASCLLPACSRTLAKLA